MAFGEKLTQFLTGKSKLERQQEAFAVKEMRKKAFAAGLREKQVQAIRLAQEKERIIAERRLKQMKQQPRGFFTGMQNFYGQPQIQPSQKQFKTVYVKKGKHYVKRKRAIAPKIKVSQPQMFDIIGGGFGGGKKVDVLGV